MTQMYEQYIYINFKCVWQYPQYMYTQSWCFTARQRRSHYFLGAPEMQTMTIYFTARQRRSHYIFRGAPEQQRPQQHTQIHTHANPRVSIAIRWTSMMLLRDCGTIWRKWSMLVPLGWMLVTPPDRIRQYWNECLLPLLIDAANSLNPLGADLGPTWANMDQLWTWAQLEPKIVSCWGNLALKLHSIRGPEPPWAEPDPSWPSPCCHSGILASQISHLEPTRPKVEPKRASQTSNSDPQTKTPKWSSQWPFSWIQPPQPPTSPQPLTAQARRNGD